MTLRLLSLAALSFAATPVFAQPSNDVLPDGPGKDVVMRVCTACHEATQFEYARMTPEQWDMTISKMQTNGAVMTADEQRAISAYLGHYLSPSSAPDAASSSQASPAAPPAAAAAASSSPPNSSPPNSSPPNSSPPSSSPSSSAPTAPQSR